MRVLVQTVVRFFGPCAVLLIATGTVAADDGRFRPPFDSTQTVDVNQPLSLSAVLTLVARTNPTLHALDWQRAAGEHEIQQAGLWPNPEFESEFEEIGWDKAGFKESEISLLLSQELQIFGQRKARKELARTGLEATTFETQLVAFDLFLEAKSRFYTLAHAQRQADLAESSVGLAQGILDNIQYRMDRGAALHSELLLAQLELQRVQLDRDAARQELAAAQTELGALWGSESLNVPVTSSEEPDLTSVMKRVAELSAEVDSTRSALLLQRQSALVHAERRLAAADARPGITLSAGYKRFQETGINSLVFGLSLPLPLFDRNQGTRSVLDARLRSLEYELHRAKLETSAHIRAGATLLNELHSRHEILDSMLLPTAAHAYETLKRSYEAGRLPYANLLDAERALIELRFEHNDILLGIHQQIVALEGATGVVLRSDKER